MFGFKVVNLHSIIYRVTFLLEIFLLSFLHFSPECLTNSIARRRSDPTRRNWVPETVRVIPSDLEELKVTWMKWRVREVDFEKCAFNNLLYLPWPGRKCLMWVRTSKIGSEQTYGPEAAMPDIPLLSRAQKPAPPPQFLGSMDSG